MNTTLYYALLGLLSTILSLEVLYLTITIVTDLCRPKPKRCTKVKTETYNVFTQPTSNEYEFLNTSTPDVSLKTIAMDSFVPQKRTSNKGKLPDNIAIEFNADRRTTIHIPDEVKNTNETEGAYSKSYDEMGVPNEDYDYLFEEPRLEKPIKVLAKIAQSVEELEFWNPVNIDTLKKISDIKDKVTELEKEIDYYNSFDDLGFFQYNRKFLEFTEQLCKVPCDREDLRMKKEEVLDYVTSCQKKLKTKKSHQ